MQETAEALRDEGKPCPYSETARCTKPEDQTCAEWDCEAWLERVKVMSRLLTIEEMNKSFGSDGNHHVGIAKDQDLKSRQATAREIFDEMEQPDPHNKDRYFHKIKADCIICRNEMKSRYIPKEQEAK